MSESLEKKELSRRNFLKQATSVAVAALSAETLTGCGAEDIEHQHHASRIYFEHRDGALLRNFERLRAIARELQKPDYGTYGLDDKRRSARLNEEITAIKKERDGLLAEFDKELIPLLLVRYATGTISPNVLEEKSLVQAYKEAGGDFEKVRQQGSASVDPRVISTISSALPYSIQTARHLRGFGDATYSPLFFGVKKRNKKISSDSAENLA